MPLFICNECGGALATAHALRVHRRVHRRIHIGEQPFQYICSLCGRRCGNSDHLARHMLIHTGYRRQQEQQVGQGILPQLLPDLELPELMLDPGLPELVLDPGQGILPELELDLEPERHQMRFGNTPGQIQQENVFGVPTTAYTQHTQHPNGTTTTVSTVNSSRGTAIVTTAQRPTSQITMTTVSQASGTFTSLGPEQHDNDCALCLEPLSDKETRTTPCNHTFHKNCLLELSKKSGTRTRDDFPCPLCRKAITDDWLKS